MGQTFKIDHVTVFKNWNTSRTYDILMTIIIIIIDGSYYLEFTCILFNYVHNLCY